MTNEATTRAFWKWFESVAGHFGPQFENETLVRELDTRINALGGFAWEIGPGRREASMLAISPGGDPDILAETRNIVACAPKIPGWEFHAAKPPKQWQPIFDIQDESGLPFRVNATDWKAVFLTRPNMASTLIIEAPGLQGLSHEHQQWAAEIAVDGLIGEERRIEDIGSILVVQKFDPRIKHRSVPITEISTLL